MLMFAVAMFTGCGVMNNMTTNANLTETSVNLSAANYHVVGTVSGSATETYVFGIGGLSKSALAKNSYADMVAKARENIEKAGAKEDINVIEGDVLEVVKGLDEKFDLIFMDAGKGHYNHLLDDILRVLSDDGVIVADNVLFRGMVANDDLVIRRKITIVKRMRAYLEMINEREELVTSIIPMGDGIALTTRRK